MGVSSKEIDPNSETPIRSELFSIERLEQHAESLASAQKVTPKTGAGRPLTARLLDNGRVLLQAYRTLTEAINREKIIMPAAEWLVDNFHVVDDQIRQINDDMPSGFYRQLPKLAGGPFVGYPRVYGIAWAFVAHTDSRFDLETLTRFVRAYQRVQPLTIGELWAVAITVRIVLVENLRRSAQCIMASRAGRDEADAVADRLLAVGARKSESPESALLRFQGMPIPTAFGAQIVQRLRDQDPAVTPALHWLDERLKAQQTTPEKIVYEEHQFQGAMSVTVRNVITSMRLMAGVEWKEFFESVSLVDELLNARSAFASMDFPTRDKYRHAIEQLARGSTRTEIEIARCAIECAQEASGKGDNRPEHDPGYYLISNGRRLLEKKIDFRRPVRLVVDRVIIGSGIQGYIAAVLLTSGVLVAIALFALAATGVAGVSLLILALLALLPASDVAITFLNHRIMTRLGPKALPALELRGGVPADLRTVVVIPTLLTAVEDIEEQIERLEVHFLANQDGDLRFALLSDWTDSTTEHAEGDERLLTTAVEGIARLNRQYQAEPDGKRFLLFHRRRIWNEGENRWMGWERKRGKLHELNRYLRGATDTSFLTAAAGTVSPCSEAPSGVRYVITLDADTRLPRRAVRRLVGKMAHPLNKPRFDARIGRVVEGYGILQPRVTPELPSGHSSSLFQHIFSGPGGMDPYAFVVSDVYQDLLGEGSYCGKGIYDIDIFETALDGRFPVNGVLSHDLLEGIYAGSALVSDIEVVEEFPSRYDVSAARQHRWARGDWQLLPWIFGGGKDPGATPGLGKISLSGRWKIADNLRRSLMAPAEIVAFAAGWTLPFATSAVWFGFIFATIALPPLLPLFANFSPRRRRISRQSHVRAIGKDMSLAFSRIGLHLAFLAHQAWLMSDALARTMFRLFVSHRHMLEWVTAAQAKFRLPLNVPGFYRRMAGGTVLTCIAGAVLVFAAADSWMIGVPLVILWLCAPVVAQLVSRPRDYAEPEPTSTADAQALRLVARRTWRFFETFVNADEHMLPPDNFQEDPKQTVAHRTSPTNLGLLLLSTVAANDFGWVGVMETVERLEATLATMSGMERFHGHFYNWYDTRDLRPLDPKYISSVDSGNLAGHLIAVGNTAAEMIKRPLANGDWAKGIRDAVILARRALPSSPHDLTSGIQGIKGIEDELDTLSRLLDEIPATASGLFQKILELGNHAGALSNAARSFCADGNNESSAEWAQDVRFWADAPGATIRSFQREIELLKPWSLLSAAVERHGGGDSTEIGQLLVSLVPSLVDLPDRCEEAIAILAAYRLGHPVGNDAIPPVETDAVIEAFRASCAAGRVLEGRLSKLKSDCAEVHAAMDFAFLFNKDRLLLSIGFQVTEKVLDSNCYDLLASEARLASFVAIAKGDVPARNWFQLGRSLTPVDRGSVLVSWSGSMFEYLMPSLVMRSPAESLLWQTNHLVVRRQREYGTELGVPWGISESAYNVRDVEFTYQYSNFGVPGLGLKRGLSEDLVIAPYATGLASMVDPTSAARNFERLEAAGARGRFGYYEALDYTPSRLPDGKYVAVIRAYMAHHQGMTLVAIDNALHEGLIRTRFHAEPAIQATELLLQERTPRGVEVARPRDEEVSGAASIHDLIQPTYRRFHTPHDRSPRTHLLSNGRYAIMVSGAGSGYSRWKDLAVTRWREDATCDSWGSYFFLRDTRSGDVWSAGYQPTGVEPDSYEVEFAEDRIEICRRDGTLTTTLEIAVSPESDAEVRRVSVTNLGSKTREIEITSYAEVVLAQPAADTAHPAFSKMFVQTEFVVGVGALLATRRRRSPDEAEVWAAHLSVAEGITVGELQYETDRERFLGRGRQTRSPISITDGKAFANTVGTVLDPVFSIRRVLRIPPGATVRVAFWTMVASTRAEVLNLADKHRESTSFERVATLAWTQAQVQLHHLGVGAEEAHIFQQLASYVLYSNPKLRPTSEALQRNESAPAVLWTLKISGDLPIVLIRIEKTDDLGIVRQLLRAHEYWRMKLLAVDLVIVNEQAQSYNMDLQAALETAIRTNESQTRPQFAGEAVQGKIFIVRADLVSPEIRMQLQNAARAIVRGRRGSLSEQLGYLDETARLFAPRRIPFPLVAKDWVKEKLTTIRTKDSRDEGFQIPAKLEFANGLGGFNAEGNEYTTVLGEGRVTPAPWINVVANPAFGFQVSSEGSSYTWSMDSRENQITPWSNDPVGDKPGEAIFIRDEQSGVLWSPTALPIREQTGTYVAQHGQGYSRFAHSSHGITTELLQFVPLEDSIKISVLKIKNLSKRSRRLSVTAYTEWVLASTRESSAPFISTTLDQKTGALFARNSWRTVFQQRVAFSDLAGRQTSWTGDRREFLGRNGTLDRPAALAAGASPLSNRVGAGFDPCSALQVQIDLEPGESVEMKFFLGDAETNEAAQTLVTKYRSADLAAVLREVTAFWNDTLGTVLVKTPDRSMDILLNRWLLYQTIACRIWARSAFYQASGAYGFRDQIQDGMALTTSQPGFTREHLIRAAGRQFVEGDFQHWWLATSGRGVRTRISDDRVWLPYAVQHYVESTGDTGVLDEKISFLEGPVLREGEHDSFFQPTDAQRSATLFEHCALALDRCLSLGAHGLPLIGTGDWNDGMNKVGEKGKGESVWLAWFLLTTLRRFAPVADAKGDRVRSASWLTHAESLRASLEREAWDGAWYLRGFYDDGSPLGSASSDECRIDSIAQSWAVISGAADAKRAADAMSEVDKKLVHPKDGLVLLFAPPFDHTAREPGYIKGYPPGIRENGGQYTHGALWSAIAYAMLGDGDKAAEVFSLLNPIHHSDTPEAALRYKVEPYVVSADVYSQLPHVGRGGWTWYTGSAGWMYRTGLEWILGFRIEGSILHMKPCIPKAWKGFEIKYRHFSTRYEISVENPRGVSRGVANCTLDGAVQAIPNLNAGASVKLIDDGNTHRVVCTLG